MSDPSVSELLALAKAGDQRAQDRLLTDYRSYVSVLARLQIGRRLGGRVETSDIVQEVLLKAHRAFTDFRGTTQAEFLAWLRRILANLLVDAVRHQGRAIRGRLTLEVEFDRDLTDLSAGLHRLASPCQSPSQSAERHEQSMRVAAAIESLPEIYRDVLLLRYFEGLSLSEVALQLGRSSEAVRKLEARALVRLRVCFADSP